jgi:hypothetical protein
VPTFCRHNRLIQNCLICSREQGLEARPVVSSSTPRVSAPRPAGGAGRATPEERARAGRGGVAAPRSTVRGGRAGVTVRRLSRGADDGYASSLVPGLKSSADAERLAAELGFAAQRLTVLENEPPGLYAEVAAAGELEQRTWLAFLIAYLGPLDDDEPFASVAAARVPWAAEPALDGVTAGPRGAWRADRWRATIDAYRAWTARSGSQEQAFTGEPAWTPERRFARLFERLGSLPAISRDARYDLLVTLGRLGVYELRGGALQFGGENEVTVAGKRLLGIGDTLLLERRAADLAEACELPVEALDLGLYNWGTGTRTRGGLAADVEPDPEVVERARDALGL